ncbi:MAG TPA: MraY family glycosyltransferase [Planctomycetota bacterium]|nr:MraY family glycosyltransferase [Planctomycetota bacterium]
MLGAFALAALTAFIASLVLNLVAIRAALRLGFLDQPGSEAHKQHATAVPYGGGLAMAIAFALAVGVGLALSTQAIDAPTGRRLAVIGAGALVLLAVGLADDRRPLRARAKFAAQAAVCAATVWAADLALDSLRPYGVVAYLAAWAWMVLVTNAYNLLDHADGFAATVAGISACVLFSGSVLAGDLAAATVWLALIGTLAGFLCWNRPPARIYMGDAGSLPLGFLIAAGTLTVVFWPSTENAGSPLAVCAPLLITAIPLFDTAAVVVKRLRRRKPVMEGDRRHISHRMARLGLSPRAALLAVAALQVALAAGAIQLRGQDWLTGAIVLLQALAIVLAVVLLETARDAQ